MIARGDMGVEIPIEHVPIIQKMIIKKCNRAGKIVLSVKQDEMKLTFRNQELTGFQKVSFLIHDIKNIFNS